MIICPMAPSRNRVFANILPFDALFRYKRNMLLGLLGLGTLRSAAAVVVGVVVVALDLAFEGCMGIVVPMGSWAAVDLALGFGWQVSPSFAG